MRAPLVLTCLVIVGLSSGCGSGPSRNSPASLSGQYKQIGYAHGGQQPVTGSTIQLWSVNATADGGLGTPMLLHTVTTSDGSGNTANSNANQGNGFNSLPAGFFTITNAYNCPVGDALVYITASGGNPGLSAGTNNPQLQMVTALGSCNNLKNNVPAVNISEQTTVGTVAALYSFMSAYNAIGASPAHTSDLTAAFALVNEYIDVQAGAAPGPTLPAGYSASTGDLNLLANVLSACVNTAGGSYNDGSACGTLFYDSSASSSNPSTDVTAAALFIRKHYMSNVGTIASLPAPQAPFQPASTPPPQDWSLPVFQLPSTPTFSLAPGQYSSAQQLLLQDADPAATIYYAIGGTATTSSRIYNGALTVGKSETVSAIAVQRGVSSSLGSTTYTITSNTPAVSVYSAAVNAGSTASVYIQANSNASGSVVTFSTSPSIGGSFSPATCTVSGSTCNVTYTPSGTAAPGTYPNALIASFTAANGYTSATATAPFYVVPAQSLTTLASSDDATLIQASDGNFYGLQATEGAGFVGSIFKATPSGNVTTIYSFTGGSDGGFPQDHLVQGSDGSFYGVTLRTAAGGNGTIFKVDASGNFTLLYSFTGSLDGARPYGGLVQGSDGYFYGTASQAGANGYGTIFRIDASGNFTLLHAFAAGSDGDGPGGSLLQGADGNFYGTTAAGGTYNAGTVFKMDASGNLTTLYSFTGGADGYQPVTGLIQGTDGYLYGATDLPAGTLFKVDTSGNFTLLHSFSGADGEEPLAALVQAADGNFYGTAWLGGVSGFGSLYKIDASGNFTSLYGFTNGADGNDPKGGLIQGADGSFYGSDAGALFKLTPSPVISPPVTLSVPNTVTHGTGFTLTYTVANASSQTMQRCFATNSAGDATGWTGVKTASTSATNATLTAPSSTGAYTYALTCGGVESGFATLNVN